MPPNTASPDRRITTASLRAIRARRERAVFVTAYDYPTAVFADRAGIDGILVGDSAAMTVLGHASTVSITLAEMLVFAAAVRRGAARAMVIGDLPFLSYQPGNRDAVRSAGAFIAVGCDAVKCEGGARIAPRVRAMTDAGIAVMGHLGLTPQSLGQLGGFRVQAKTVAAAEALLRDALALQRAGAFAILLEAVPPEAATFLRARIDLPLYGIGAGPDLDGQLVISHDILGSFVGEIHPRFVRRYAHLDAVTSTAFREYAADVRAGRFPAPEQCYTIDAGNARDFEAARASLPANTSTTSEP